MQHLCKIFFIHIIYIFIIIIIILYKRKREMIPILCLFQIGLGEGGGALLYIKNENKTMLPTFKIKIFKEQFLAIIRILKNKCFRNKYFTCCNILVQMITILWQLFIYIIFPRLSVYFEKFHVKYFLLIPSSVPFI